MLNAPAPLQARAADRLAGFPTFLRANGFAVGGGDAVQVLRTVERVGVLDPHVLRWSLQALLCGRSDEWRRFPELFDAWFLPANRWQKPERRDTPAGVMPRPAVIQFTSPGRIACSEPTLSRCMISPSKR